MRYIYFFFAMIFAVFGNTYISDYIGYTMRTTVAFTPLVLYCIYKFTKGDYSNKTDNTYKYLVIVGILIVIVNLLLGNNYIQSMLTMIFLPCLFYIFFLRLNKKEKSIFRLSLLIFFITNCLIAIWEYKNQTFFIKHEIDERDLLESWSFRARALLGHPLANALIMSPMILYILISDLDIKIRLALFAIGEYALLCFNTRSGVLATTICAIPLLYKELKKTRKSVRKYYYLMTFVIGVLSVIYVINNNIGGRLVNISSSEGFLSDDSSLARLEILKFVDYISIDELIFGSPDGYENLLIAMNLMGVENGLITLILTYGIFLGVALAFCLILFYWKRMVYLGKIERICIMACYIGIGLTNPHIAFALAWYYFLFDFIAFIPNNAYMNLRKSGV